MLKFKIKPFDVLFFGGGKPFNRGDTAKSIFPPSPHTFASAICAKIYYSKKQSEVKDILKSVYGPFLYNEKENKLYFSKPADIYTKRKEGEGLFDLELEDDNNFSLLKFENTNKPNWAERLSIYKGDKIVESFEGFISQNGLQEWIDGKKVQKESIKKFSDIFEYENRVGIRQNIETHTVVSEDGLYRIDFLRLKEGWSFVFYVEFNFSSLNEELNDDEKIFDFFNQSERVLKLGGEKKVVYYDVSKVDDINSIFKKPNVNNGDIIKILFLTHSTFNSDNPFSNLSDIKIISAVINGYLNLAIKSKGLGLNNFTKRAFKAGGVFYVRVLNKDFVDNLWFEPFFQYRKENNKTFFIGSNLIIYGKLGEEK